MQTTENKPKRLARDNAVAAYLDVTRQSVWAFTRNDPTFPRPLRLSDRCTRWDMDEVEAWAKARAVHAKTAA